MTDKELYWLLACAFVLGFAAAVLLLPLGGV